MQSSLPLLGSGFQRRTFSLPLGSRAVLRPLLSASATLGCLPADSLDSSDWLLSQSQSQRYVTTDCQLASLSWYQAPIWGLRPDFSYCQTVAGLFMWDALSDERTGLSFTIAAGPRQLGHFWVRVPPDSWPYFTVSDSRLPQPGGPGPRIYIPQQQGGPVIPPGTGFPFRRLLWLAGSQWRYSTPPKSKLCYDRRFSRPVPLGIKHPSGA
jgi:hypothetical protein